MAEQTPNGKGKHNIHLKYRVSFINEDTFDEVKRVRLSVLNILIFICITLLLASAIVVSVIFYTPIREYVPGYPDSETTAMMVENAEMVDSLKMKLQQEVMYWDGVRRVLQGEIPNDVLADTSAVRNKELVMESVRLEASQEEIDFRSQIEEEEQYNLGLLDRLGEMKVQNTVLFSPVKGMITDRFDSNIGHYGIDLATAPKEHILAVAGGTVILVDYSITAGNMITIQHANNVLSTYRHASKIFKQTGDKVKSGEVIGVVGNTGTLSTGVHLHLEIWQDGEAMNPETLIVF
jgi:hypothetical protein